MSAHDEVVAQHLTRLKSATINKLKRTDLSKWVSQNTFMNGRPFNYAGHEFQERILDDPSSELSFLCGPGPDREC